MFWSVECENMRIRKKRIKMNSLWRIPCCFCNKDIIGKDFGDLINALMDHIEASPVCKEVNIKLSEIVKPKKKKGRKKDGER